MIEKGAIKTQKVPVSGMDSDTRSKLDLSRHVSFIDCFSKMLKSLYVFERTRYFLIFGYESD